MVQTGLVTHGAVSPRPFVSARTAAKGGVSTFEARFGLVRVESENRSENNCDSGGGTRTPDTRIMIPLL